MLTHLLIKNYALIRELELMPNRELNVITGETGAGKSIMLGAIGLLLGNRADTKALFDQTEKCIIEGTFEVAGYDMAELFEEAEIDYDDTCLIRREISPSGKSRTFINDTPVNLDVLRRVGAQLMDIHSQHDTLQLGSAAFQTGIVDSYAQNKAHRQAYAQTFTAWKQAETRLKSLRDQATQAQKESDYNQFLLDELLAAKLSPNEQADLEQEQNLLENAEDIKLKLQQALGYLSEGEDAPIVPRLKIVQQLLDKLGHFSENYRTLSQRLQACFAEARDIADEIEGEEQSIEIDNERIAFVQERLDLIYHLQKKHSANSTKELLDIQAELEQKVGLLLSLDEDIADAENQTQTLQKQAISIAQTLTETRTSAIEPIETELKNLFREVGMPNATIKIKLEVAASLTPNGADMVTFLFSANKGVAPQELKNVASGGEFSRLMLLIKYILAGKTALPTIIFDEIDTGISGEIAIKVGGIMQQMGKKHQIIAITHLPQIAARGTAHYYVYKDNSGEKTVSKIRQLTPSEQIVEIAQMISGEPPSAASLDHARELLEMSH